MLFSLLSLLQSIKHIPLQAHIRCYFSLPMELIFNLGWLFKRKNLHPLLVSSKLQVLFVIE